MSLLLLAMGGLVFTDAGGFFRDGVSSNDVASIDGEKISIITFDNTLRRRLSGVQITPQQAYQFGLVNQILSQEIQTTLLKQIAEESGIALNKKDLGQAIHQAFQGNLLPGETTKDALERLLQNWNLSEQRFIDIIERDSKAAYTNKLIAGGFATLPPSLAKDLYSYENEKRNIEMIVFPNKEMSKFEKPTPERLKNYYEANQQRFITPQNRDFKIIKLELDPIKKQIEISEQQAKDIYNEDKDLFSLPEKRLIEQAIYSTEQDAKAAYKTIQDGKSFKEATKGATTHIEPTLQSKGDVTIGLAENIFALDKGQTSAPLQSPLGWHIVKVEDITPAKTQSFKDVKDSIIEEISENLLADQLDAIANQLDDFLASGMTPEEIQKEIPIKIESYEAISLGDDNKLPAYTEKATDIINSAFELFEGEASPLLETAKGDLVAVYLTKITDATPMPFDDVKEEIIKTLTDLNQKQANEKHVETLLNELDENKPSLDKIARKENKYLQKRKNIERQGKQEEPLSTQSAQQIFAAKVGEVISIQTTDGFALIKITESKLPDTSKIEEEELQTLTQTAISQSRSEAASLLLESERKNKTIKINNALLERAYGSQEQ